MPTPAPDQVAPKSKFFAQFPELRADQSLLEPAIQIMDYGSGETLFQRGAPVTHIRFLLSGRVEEAGVKRLENGLIRPRLVRTVEPVRALGLYDFLYQQLHSTHAIARELSEVLLIEVQAFEKLLYYRPDLPDLFIPRKVIERMRTLPLLAALDLTE
jgi:CRP-like cAMP-binding protein